jgi:hypothetical protein
VLDKDSHAKVQMRRKVRGLRTIEQAVWREETKTAVSQEQPPMAWSPPAGSNGETLAATLTAEVPTRDEEVAGAVVSCAAGHLAAEPSPAGQVVLDYCAAVRGILNDDQGGPLHPPGLRMADALAEVRESLQRNLSAKKGGLQKSNCSV